MHPLPLTTPAGHAALLAAHQLGEVDPLAAASRLRGQGIDPELASAALTQVALRRRAVGKFGPDAERLLFTRAGLEQATRPVVAARRAQRLWGAGVRTLIDLGCGLGADAMACARAGIRVTAIEADAETAAVTGANVATLGLDSLIDVRHGDATAADLDGYDAAFCDPARRSGGRRVFDPAAYSPPWDFVVGLAGRVPITVLKLAPGIDPALLPHGAELELVSVDGEVVEAAAWCGPLATVPRRATVIRGTIAHQLTGGGLAEAPVAKPGAFITDPDGAVVRSHLVAEFAQAHGGWIGDPTIAYVWSDEPVSSPFGRCFAVDELLPFSLKRLRTALRDRGVGRVEILKRGSALDVEQLRRELRLAGPTGASVLLTMVAGRPFAIIANPV
ncbi:SAM-dependent methyltransferase [Allocatelliglobosispora scoriae]|uniref:SAM-dependent methyltransferase n=1 Tax=Allocatelliglobosispora scoriae TaxID=643052 RepID=A0A841BR63_9ACTN|nr:class I SAM-dependent methyltransferase [Allocatelliglobosispora scoriae]MBB5871547.1 SAM-dependent methyltransferase [Allocatelliglobosispora scoriae]